MGGLTKASSTLKVLCILLIYPWLDLRGDGKNIFLYLTYFKIQSQLYFWLKCLVQAAQQFRTPNLKIDSIRSVWKRKSVILSEIAIPYMVNHNGASYVLSSQKDS